MPATQFTRFHSEAEFWRKTLTHWPYEYAPEEKKNSMARVRGRNKPVERLSLALEETLSNHRMDKSKVYIVQSIILYFVLYSLDLKGFEFERPEFDSRRSQIS
jgi:hypothetical protein